jgi:hypothetical protein
MPTLIPTLFSSYEPTALRCTDKYITYATSQVKLFPKRVFLTYTSHVGHMVPIVGVSVIGPVY